MSKPNVPTQRRYPPELRERAVRMVKEAIAIEFIEHSTRLGRIKVSGSADPMNQLA